MVHWAWWTGFPGLYLGQVGGAAFGGLADGLLWALAHKASPFVSRPMTAGSAAGDQSLRLWQHWAGIRTQLELSLSLNPHTCNIVFPSPGPAHWWASLVDLSSWSCGGTALWTATEVWLLVPPRAASWWKEQ